MAEAVFHAEARRGLRSALDWYRSRSRTVARKFAIAVDRTLAIILAHPDLFGRYDDEYRMARVDRFPYILVYYERQDGSTIVIAVAHASREPGYWQGRS